MARGDNVSRRSCSRAKRPARGSCSCREINETAAARPRSRSKIGRRSPACCPPGSPSALFRCPGRARSRGAEINERGGSRTRRSRDNAFERAPPPLFRCLYSSSRLSLTRRRMNRSLRMGIPWTSGLGPRSSILESLTDLRWTEILGLDPWISARSSLDPWIRTLDPRDMRIQSSDPISEFQVQRNDASRNRDFTSSDIRNDVSRAVHNLKVSVRTTKKLYHVNRSVSARSARREKSHSRGNPPRTEDVGVLWDR